MEDTRGVKRRKQDGAHELGQFIGRGGVSLTGLQKIGQMLAKSSSAADALASSTRKSLMETNKRAFDEVCCCEQLELEKGGHFKWELCDPGRLLAMRIANSRRLQDIYAELANARTIDIDNPLGLIVAFDEFTPGNK